MQYKCMIATSYLAEYHLIETYEDKICNVSLA